MTIGERMRSRRKQLGFSAEYIAENSAALLLPYIAMKTDILKRCLLTPSPLLRLFSASLPLT